MFGVELVSAGFPSPAGTGHLPNANRGAAVFDASRALWAEAKDYEENRTKSLGLSVEALTI